MATHRRTIRVGTRGSRLALAQTAIVVDALRSAHPDVIFEVVTISTKGDANTTAPISAIGVGVFVKELESALTDGRVDVAVHSAKDMPADLPDGFAIAAVLKREDPRDVLVSRHTGGLRGLPEGARVGTGSARRRALVLAQRPDLVVEPLRGNVDTRLAKLRSGGGPDAILLAAAGLARLGRLSEVSEFLDPAVFVPAIGQGALAVEARADDLEVIGLVRPLDHRDSRIAVDAERAFLRAAGGGCSVPVSAHVEVTGPRLVIRAFAASADGRRVARHEAHANVAHATEAGVQAATALLAAAGPDMLVPASPDTDD